jgi:hypothetical protein
MSAGIKAILKLLVKQVVNGLPKTQKSLLQVGLILTAQNLAAKS